jgi:WxcM-like, C-terminal
MVRHVSFRNFQDANGSLVVFEGGKSVPFDIRRIFTVVAKSGDKRGDHAHKKCTQLLICISGEISVICDDGLRTQKFTLDNMSSGLLISPWIWARQEYIKDDSVLMVICDRGYEVDDYIRNYEEFKKLLESRNINDI